jgi:hypothetical protein
METNFKEVKEQIIDLAKQNSACTREYKKALNSETYSDLLKVVTDNINWCYNTGIFSKEILSKIPDESLVSANIFFNKENVIQREGVAYYHSSTSEHYGSSTSKHYDSSTSKHYESSTSKHYGSSTSKHYDSSTSEHYGSSTSKHYESSTSEHYDSSTSKHYDSSTSEHYGSSTSKYYDSSTFGSVYELKDSSVIKDQAIVRERNTGKVYFKKDAFEIVQL